MSSPSSPSSPSGGGCWRIKCCGLRDCQNSGECKSCFYKIKIRAEMIELCASVVYSATGGEKWRSQVYNNKHPCLNQQFIFAFDKLIQYATGEGDDIPSDGDWDGLKDLRDTTPPVKNSADFVEDLQPEDDSCDYFQLKGAVTDMVDGIADCSLWDEHVRYHVYHNTSIQLIYNIWKGKEAKKN